MYARTRYFPTCPLLSPTLALTGLLFFSAFLRAEPPVAEDTVVPNTFAFTSETYFVDKSATNAVITVDFSPGNRSWIGWVNFTTSNGTAVAGADYQPTNGTLNFSGPGTPIPVIKVPIYKNDSRRDAKVTVELFLSNSNADIPRPHATLVIVDTNQMPSLQISQSYADSIQLSWPAIYPNIVLEKNSDLLNPNWTEVSSGTYTNENYCFVSDVMTDPPAFYRLRKTGSP